MPTLPTPELEFIEKYGPLPQAEEREQIRRSLAERRVSIDLDEYWITWWRMSDHDRDLLERLYEFWGELRNKIKE